MVLRNWDPFPDMRRRRGGLDRIWNGSPPWDESRESYSWAIPVDVVREGDEIVVHASLPGASPDSDRQDRIAFVGPGARYCK